MPALPGAAAPPGGDALKSMADAIEKVKGTTAAIYERRGLLANAGKLGWPHYGKQYAVLCSGQVGRSTSSSRTDPSITACRRSSAPTHAPGDGLRRWLHAETDPRVLWDPVAGHRSETEWDDHGEMYPMWNEGPDVNAEVTVPAGVARVSLYLVNLHGQVFLPRPARLPDRSAARAGRREGWGRGGRCGSSVGRWRAIPRGCRQDPSPCRRPRPGVVGVVCIAGLGARTPREGFLRRRVQVVRRGAGREHFCSRSAGTGAGTRSARACLSIGFPGWRRRSTRECRWNWKARPTHGGRRCRMTRRRLQRSWRRRWS